MEGHDPSLDSEVFELEDDEYVESGERLNDLSEEQREFVKKEEYVIIRCRSPRQDTLETETGRSVASEVSGDVPNDPVMNGKGSPHGSDEGLGDSISVSESVDSAGHVWAPTQRHSITKDVKENSGEGTPTKRGPLGPLHANSEEETEGLDEVEGGVIGKMTRDEENESEGTKKVSKDKISAITVEMCNGHSTTDEDVERDHPQEEEIEVDDKSLNIPEVCGHLTAETATMSPASSNGGVYAVSIDLRHSRKSGALSGSTLHKLHRRRLVFCLFVSVCSCH